MAWVALFVFLGKLAGTAKEMAVALPVGLLQLHFYSAGLALVSVLASQRGHKLVAIGASANLALYQSGR